MGALSFAGGVLPRAEQAAGALSSALGTRIDARELLTGRAALLGLSARGRVSAGGATHLLEAADGWCALTLSRADDIAAVPALLESDALAHDPWPAVHRWAAGRTVVAVTERARLLDLPVAALAETQAAPPLVTSRGGATGPRKPAGLLVADLTSMWAGPLCGQLLAAAGAVVVKVESPRRPDGTRSGHRGFFDWMNAGKFSYAIDFDEDRDKLLALLAAADVVLEGSRPAALERRRLGPDDYRARPGRIWVRVTGHGTAGANADRVAFGDDAAIAGGLIAYDDQGPVFCGDAIADPLTGLEAAAAVVASLERGGAELIEVSMAGTAACYGPTGRACAVETVLPGIPERATELGAHNAEVDRLVAERRCTPC